MLHITMQLLAKCQRKQNGQLTSTPFQFAHLKVLKAEYVQDADGLVVLFPSYPAVELADDPGEALSVKSHGHRVSGIHSLLEEKLLLFN